MDDVKLWLTSQGYTYAEEGARLKVELGGLSHSVMIENDFSKGILLVVTNEIRMALAYGIMLFWALGGVGPTVTFLSALFSTVAIVGFVAIILTELKVQKIRERVLYVNQMD